MAWRNESTISCQPPGLLYVPGAGRWQLGVVYRWRTAFVAVIDKHDSAISKALLLWMISSHTYVSPFLLVSALSIGKGKMKCELFSHCDAS